MKLPSKEEQKSVNIDLGFKIDNSLLDQEYYRKFKKIIDELGDNWTLRGKFIEFFGELSGKM